MSDPGDDALPVSSDDEHQRPQPTSINDAEYEFLVQIPESLHHVIESRSFRNWLILYPLYLDATRSIHDGRRVSLKHAYPHPNIRAMFHAAVLLHIPVIREVRKMHPKEFGKLGRLRVLLQDPETRAWFNPLIRTKRALLEQIGEKLKTVQPGVPEMGWPVPAHILQLIQMGNAAATEAGIGGFGKQQQQDVNKTKKKSKKR